VCNCKRRKFEETKWEPEEKKLLIEGQTIEWSIEEKGKQRSGKY